MWPGCLELSRATTRVHQLDRIWLNGTGSDLDRLNHNPKGVGSSPSSGMKYLQIRITTSF